jgi:hypothetical protein
VPQVRVDSINTQACRINTHPTALRVESTRDFLLCGKLLMRPNGPLTIDKMSEKVSFLEKWVRQNILNSALLDLW